MTNEQAIERLTEEHGAIEMVKDGVFVANRGDAFEMFRLTDGVLEQRFDDEVHSCRWEPVD